MQLTPLGWPVIEPGSEYLHDWVIPGWTGRARMRRGAVGFILAYMLLFIHERVERLDEGHPADDWGHNKRQVTGGTDWSEHASGSAFDFNATQHPYNVATARTFTGTQIDRIHRRLKWLTRVAGTTAVRWGGDYRNHPDGMHLEVACAGKFSVAKRTARALMVTPRGRRVLKANPSQRPFITS